MFVSIVVLVMLFNGVLLVGNIMHRRWLFATINSAAIAINILTLVSHYGRLHI